jgi:type II secretory pathway component PulF
MAQFHYQAATPQGKLIEGMMEASEERIVASRLQDQGYVPLRIAEPGQMQAKTGAARRQLTLSALPSLPRRGTSRFSLASSRP